MGWNIFGGVLAFFALLFWFLAEKDRCTAKNRDLSPQMEERAATAYAVKRFCAGVLAFMTLLSWLVLQKADPNARTHTRDAAVTENRFK